MNGLITAKQQFFFPDSPLGEMPASLRIVSAKNGKAGIQLLFACPEPSARITVTGSGFDVQLHEMIPVPVEYNTGNGVDQGGAMVILRAVQASEGGAGMPARLPGDLLERVTARVMHECPEVQRVFYDCTPSRSYAMVAGK